MGKKKTYKDRIIEESKNHQMEFSPFLNAQPVGMYTINGNFHIHFFTKPKRIHRFFTRVLLGWKWSNKII